MYRSRHTSVRTFRSSGAGAISPPMVYKHFRPYGTGLQTQGTSVPSHLILYNGGRSRRNIYATKYGHGSVNG